MRSGVINLPRIDGIIDAELRQIGDERGFRKVPFWGGKGVADVEPLPGRGEAHSPPRILSVAKQARHEGMVSGCICDEHAIRSFQW